MPHEPGPLWQFPEGKLRVTGAPSAAKVAVEVGGSTVELTVGEARAVAMRLIEKALEAETSDAPAEIGRIPMQFLLLAAEQADDSGTAETCDVGCWIADQTRTNAFHIAYGWVSGNGWEVLEVVEHRPVTRADYESQPEQLPYFEQAIIDGEVFLYEIDDPNEESDDAS